MVESVALLVDGRRVVVPESTSVLGACRRAGVDVPTLCHLETLTPAAACRLCVVEVEGSRALVAACARRVEEGMVVTTASERVARARRMVLELLAATVDLAAAPGLVALGAAVGTEPGRHAGGVPVPPEIDNELYVRDLAKCVLCYRCVAACGDDAQHTYAIAVVDRGDGARIGTEFDVPLPDSACVFCGNCVAVCPTGALVVKTEFDLRRSGSWDPAAQTVVRTVCGYCGVGCNLDVRLQGERIVEVTSPLDHDVTRGSLCVKGRFGWTHLDA